MSWLAADLDSDQGMKVAVKAERLLARLPAVTVETFTMFPSMLMSGFWDLVVA